MIRVWGLLFGAALLATACGPVSETEPAEATPLRPAPAAPQPNSTLAAIIAPGDFERGTGQTIIIDYRDVPPGAGLVIALERAGGTEDINRYAGPLGAIEPEAAAVSGSGQTTLAWNGRTVFCPDRPWGPGCVVEPGRYRLKASIYADTDVTVVWPSMEEVVGHLPALLGVSYSKPFVIGGKPDLGPLASALRSRASHWVNRQPMAEAFWMYGRGDWFVDEGGPLQHGRRGWCRDFAPRAPMKGTVTACAPDSAVSAAGVQIREFPVTYHGRPRWPAGAKTGREVWDAALSRVPDAARLGYAGWPPTATGRQQAIPAAHYRSDLSAWLVVVHTGGEQNVLVRVPDLGQPCVVGRFPGDAPRPHHLENDLFRCG